MVVEASVKMLVHEEQTDCQQVQEGTFVNKKQKHNNDAIKKKKKKKFVVPWHMGELLPLIIQVLIKGNQCRIRYTY